METGDTFFKNCSPQHFPQPEFNINLNVLLSWALSYGKYPKSFNCSKNHLQNILYHATEFVLNIKPFLSKAIYQQNKNSEILSQVQQKLTVAMVNTQ